MISTQRPALILWLSAAMLPAFATCLAAVFGVASEVFRASAALPCFLALIAFLSLALLPLAGARLPDRRRAMVDGMGAFFALALPGAALALYMSLVSVAEAGLALVYLIALSLICLCLGRLAHRRGFSESRIVAVSLSMAAGLVIFLPFALWLREMIVVGEDAGDLTPGRAVLSLLEGSHPLQAALGLGLIFVGALAAIFAGGRRARGAAAIVVIAGMGWTLTRPAPMAWAQDSEAPIQILKVTSLLGPRLRPKSPAPLKLRVARAQAGDWTGELAVRVGDRRYAVEITVPGGSLEAPVEIALLPVVLGRESIVFEARGDGGSSRLDTPPFKTLLLDEDQILCGYLGAESQTLAEDALVRERLPNASLVRIERGDLSILASGGGALDAIFVARPLTKSESLALRAFAAQGGAVIFAGVLPDNPRVIFEDKVAARRVALGLFLCRRSSAKSGAWLKDAMPLLARHIQLRGRLRDEALDRAFASEPFGSDARLDGGALLGILLAYGAMLGAVFAFLGGRGDGLTGPGLKLLLAALLTTLVLKVSVMSPETMAAESLRIEDRVLGDQTTAGTNYLRLRSLRGATLGALELATTSAVEAWFPGPSAVARCEDDLRVSGGRTTLGVALDPEAGRVYRWRYVGKRAGGGLTIEKTEQGLRVQNNGSRAATGLFVVIGGEARWLGILKAGEARRVPDSGKAWHELVDDRFPARRRWLSPAVASRLRARQVGGPGGVVFAVFDEAEEIGVGAAVQERNLGRLLALSWLDAELD